MEDFRKKKNVFILSFIWNASIFHFRIVFHNHKYQKLVNQKSLPKSKTQFWIKLSGIRNIPPDEIQCYFLSCKWNALFTYLLILDSQKMKRPPGEISSLNILICFWENMHHIHLHQICMNGVILIPKMTLKVCCCFWHTHIQIIEMSKEGYYQVSWKCYTF